MHKAKKNFPIKCFFNFLILFLACRSFFVFYTELYELKFYQCYSYFRKLFTFVKHHKITFD